MTDWQWDIDGWIVLAGILSAVSCALLGNYLVLRRMSLMGDAISHAVLPGLAIAFLISHSRSSVPMFIGAVLAGLLTAVLSQTVHRYGKVEHGAAMGVVFSLLFALGLILIRQAADHVDLDPGCVLYGNINQIPLDAIGNALPPPILNLGIVLLVNVAFLALFYKEMKLSTFDPQLATSVGIPADLMHYALMVLVSVTTVANFESVGSILVIAMLIVPGVTAHLLTDRLGAMIAVSIIVAVFSAVVGHVLAAFGPAWIGLPGSTHTSAMMAVVAGGLLLIAVLLAPRHGVISRAWHRLVLSMNIIRDDVLSLLLRWQEVRPEGGRPIRRAEVLAAIGDSSLARWSLRSLARGGLVTVERIGRGDDAAGMKLTATGLARATGLIRSHRLWEAYIDKHFKLPTSHLHLSAERVEHYITSEMRDEMSADLTSPQHDPHGRAIPPEQGEG